MVSHRLRTQWWPWSGRVNGWMRESPLGGVRGFRMARITPGAYVVQIWSRDTPESGPKTLVLHRVEWLDGLFSS